MSLLTELSCTVLEADSIFGSVASAAAASAAIPANIVSSTLQATSITAGTLQATSITAGTLQTSTITTARIVYTSANLAVGSSAGLRVSAGNNHIALGTNAGSIVTDQPARFIPALGITGGNVAASNIAIGNSAGTQVYGAENIALGFQAGQQINISSTSLYSGGRNVAIGFNAGTLVSGSSNIAIGANAGNSMQGYNNVAIGTDALQNWEGDDALQIQCKAFFIGDQNPVALGLPSLLTPFTIPTLNALRGSLPPSLPTVSDSVLIQRILWLLTQYGFLVGPRYTIPV